MAKRGAEWLLAFVILARSTSFAFSKIILGGTMGTFNLLAVRFLLAFILLAALFFRRLRVVKRCTVCRGAILGFIYFLVMTCELSSLHTIPSSTASLLENCAIILVPLFTAAVYRRRPRAVELLCAVTAMAGVALISLTGGGGGLGFGGMLALLAAALYAVAIIVTDRFAHEDDSLLLGILEVGFLGLFALLASLLTETPRLPQDGTEWGCLLALVVVCTCFGYTLQPVAQSHTTAERAGVFCALNPAGAAILGALILHERFTAFGLVGIVLILGSILLPKLMKGKKTVEKTYETYLFDMDGTLLNTLDDIRDAMNVTLTRHGFDAVSPETVRDALGNGARELMRACLPRGEQTPDFEAITAEYRAYYDAHTCVKTAPYPGVPEMLKTLTRRGAKFAIVSNKPDTAAKALGARFFPGVLTIGEASGTPRKPHRAMVDKALSLLHAPADTAVYVGDSEVDLATAKNSGLDLIAVAWGFRGREKLEALGAQHVVDDCAALVKIRR